MTLSKRILWIAANEQPELAKRLSEIVWEHTKLNAELLRDRIKMDNVSKEFIHRRIDELIFERESILSYLALLYDDNDYTNGWFTFSNQQCK